MGSDEHAVAMGQLGTSRRQAVEGILGRGTKVQTPLFPTYSEVRVLLPIWEGEYQEAVRGMIQAIREQSGTPQDPVDWTDPDVWIDERLEGHDAELARRIWEGSRRAINPRHVYGSYLFVNTFDMLEEDGSGVYRLTDFGHGFLEDDSEVIRALDEAEGIPELLAIIQTKGRARRSDLLDDWAEFLLRASTYKAESTVQSTLRHRILNALDRGLLDKDGVYYSVTSKGATVMADAAPTAEVTEADRVRTALREANQAARVRLRELLSEMHPYAFEELVRDLLDSMGYEDVVVTKESGDRGVDVVGRVQFGITAVTEVVQVKRHKANIRRPVIDQLRGVLPFHDAIRGTIITLGGFSKGCAEVATFPGAAPVTLIDGDRLIELLIEHGIGVKTRDLKLLDVDEDALMTTPEETEVPPAEELSL